MTHQTLTHNLRRQEDTFHIHTKAVVKKLRPFFYSGENIRDSYITWGKSEVAVSTMSAEQPGKSSTRDGLRLNVGFSLLEGSEDP